MLHLSLNVCLFADEADFPFPNVQKTGGNPWNKENIVTSKL